MATVFLLLLLLLTSSWLIGIVFGLASCHFSWTTLNATFAWVGPGLGSVAAEEAAHMPHAPSFITVNSFVAETERNMQQKLIFKPSTVTRGWLRHVACPTLLLLLLLQLQQDKQIIATVNRRAFLCQQNYQEAEERENKRKMQLGKTS